jgi:hypothetical protein
VFADPIESEQTFHQRILMHWWSLYELSSLICSEEDTLEIFPSILDTPCMYIKAFRCQLLFQIHPVCILYTHWVSDFISSLVDICVGITRDRAEHSYRQ